VLSPMVIVPLRWEPLFDEMRYVTVPLPLPFAPLVIVSHPTLLWAVHVHPVNVATETVPVPASNATDCVGGVSVKRHGAASCMTRTRLSLTTISASRVVGTLFAATLNSTLPFPCPDVGERSVIQAACVVAVQAHSG